MVGVRAHVCRKISVKCPEHEDRKTLLTGGAKYSKVSLSKQENQIMEEEDRAPSGATHCTGEQPQNFVFWHTHVDKGESNTEQTEEEAGTWRGNKQAWWRGHGTDLISWKDCNYAFKSYILHAASTHCCRGSPNYITLVNGAEMCLCQHLWTM